VVAERTRFLLVVAALVASLVVPAAAVVAAPTPPACRVDDVVTPYRGLGDWYRSLLDMTWQLPSGYAPRDLVPVTRAGVSGNGSVRSIVIGDLRAMYRDARAAGAPFAVQSAYRSYSTQASTFRSWVARAGYKRALLASARPGHSEHQLGTALDLKSPGGPEPWSLRDWGRTKAGAWIAANSWKYGFVISYPAAASPGRTCYKYEPWHVRYFGRPIAAEIHGSGLSPREWLIANGAAGEWTGPDATGRRATGPAALARVLVTLAKHLDLRR
jgi:zinc D-Ala-D-Ala carboxypeptidase